MSDKGEYRMISLPVRLDPSVWERAVNDAAADGFEWVDSFAASDGAVVAVMRRDREDDEEAFVGDFVH